MLWHTGRMQQEWEQNRPSPTSGGKAMVPSTGTPRLAQTAVLRGTQELGLRPVCKKPQGSYGPWYLPCWRRTAASESFTRHLPGTVQLHSAKHCPKRPQDPQLILGTLAWYAHGFGTYREFTGASPSTSLPDSQTPPKYATYIHPGRRLALGGRLREAQEPVGSFGLFSLCRESYTCCLCSCSWKSALTSMCGQWWGAVHLLSEQG